LETKTNQLHDKVQQLIEQYTKDKKRLSELEAILSDKKNDSQGLIAQIDSLKSQLQVEKAVKERLTVENNELRNHNSDMEQTIKKFENFAEDLSKDIDGLIPIIDKL
jgi:chromosome segregation ATPase